MASTIVGPLAQRLATVISNLDVTPAVTGVKWTPRPLTGTGPWGVVEIPRIERTGLQDDESEIGTWDWVITFPVVLYVDLKDPERDQERVVSLLEAFVNAVDENPLLKDLTDSSDVNGDPQILFAKVTAGDPTVDLIGESRPLLGYECEAQILKHVPQAP